MAQRTSRAKTKTRANNRKPPVVMLDWDAEDEGFGLLPEGSYQAVISEIKQQPPGASGFPYVSVTFTIQHADYTGRKMWSNWSFSPGAVPIWMRYLSRMGIDKTGQQGFSEFEQLTTWLNNELIGEPCTLVCKHEIYQGESKARVSNVRAAGEDEETDYDSPL